MLRAPLLSLALLARAAAPADGPSPEEVAARLDLDGARVVVVRGGQPGRALDEAAWAMVEGLRADGRASLVMDDLSLGPPFAIPDEEIAKRAAWTPVDRIVIVRVVDGARLRTAVTILRKNGEPVASLGAAPAHDAPPPAPAADGGPSADAYDRLYVAFESARTLRLGWAGASETTMDELHPYQGRARRSLEGSAFYDVVGRPDLASAYRTRSAIRWTSLATSTALVVAGAVSIFVMEATRDNRDFILPISLFVGGAAAATVYPFLDPHPVSAREARELAEEHNERLRAELAAAPVP